MWSVQNVSGLLPAASKIPPQHIPLSKLVAITMWCGQIAFRRWDLWRKRISNKSIAQMLLCAFQGRVCVSSGSLRGQSSLFLQSQAHTAIVKKIHHIFSPEVLSKEADLEVRSSSCLAPPLTDPGKISTEDLETKPT